MQLFFSIVIWLILGFSTAYVAQRRGRDPAIWFVIGLFLGLLGLLLVFILPPIGEEETTTSGQEIQISPLAVRDIPSNSEHLPKGYENNQWFYLNEEREQIGPLTFEELKDKWREGTIEEDCFVWCEEMPEWHHLGELKLFEKN